MVESSLEHDAEGRLRPRDQAQSKTTTMVVWQTGIESNQIDQWHMGKGGLGAILWPPHF